jgi:TnpA family transposase
MARRFVLSSTQRTQLLALPQTDEEMIRHYTLSSTDLAFIRQRRGSANRLGMGAQLCLLRFPGNSLSPGTELPAPIVRMLARQLRIDPARWPEYAARDETRREHLIELRGYLGSA